MNLTFELRNPHPDPEIVDLFDTKDDYAVGLLVALEYADDHNQDGNFDHRHNVEAVRTGEGGVWVQRTLSGEVLQYLGADCDGNDLIDTAHLRLLMPSEQLVITRGDSPEKEDDYLLERLDKIISGDQTGETLRKLLNLLIKHEGD